MLTSYIEQTLLCRICTSILELRHQAFGNSKLSEVEIGFTVKHIRY